MKYWLIFIGFCVSVSLGAQQEWVYSMQSLNMYDGNAAAAGMYERSSVNLRYRHQFAGFSGAPTTALVTANSSFGKLGAGVRLRSETIGAFNRTMATIHLAYRLDVGSGQLSFGMGGGLRVEQLDINSITLSDDDDPWLMAGSNTTPIVEAALLYRTNHFFVGVEASHLLAQKRWLNSADETDVELLAIAGSEHPLNGQLSLRPLVALRYNAAGAMLPEAQLGVWWKKTIWVGAGYRLSAEAYAFVEYRLKRKIRLAYGFGLPTAGVGSAQFANHEVMLGLLFGKKERSVESIRYFQ